MLKNHNCDETGISTIQPLGKILATKEQKRVRFITSCGREKYIPLMCTMSVAGGFIPPMFIFPKKSSIPLLETDGPTESLYKC